MSNESTPRPNLVLQNGDIVGESYVDYDHEKLEEKEDGELKEELEEEDSTWRTRRSDSMESTSSEFSSR